MPILTIDLTQFTDPFGADGFYRKVLRPEGMVLVEPRVSNSF